jgi:hypothetical protein
MRAISLLRDTISLSRDIFIKEKLNNPLFSEDH